MSALPTADAMYRAVAQKDESFIGVFVVAVKTTRIFCRPGCPARAPLAKNVEFFARAADALSAGYRPCKRCRPMEAVPGAPEWVRSLTDRLSEQAGERVRDRDVRALGVDPERARRYFKRHYGMTFQAYARAMRLGQALRGLREGSDMVETGMDAGYESLSGFREAFEKTFGRTAGNAGEAACLAAQWLETPLGPMLAVAGDAGLCLLEFVDRRMLETQIERAKRLFDSAIVPGEHPALAQVRQELEEYFAGERTAFETPLALKGTPFQERVWRLLLEIPYGEVRSYGWMAERLGEPGAMRAVGRANGDNRIAIVVPCHRVIRADGTLCGYGGGLWRKRRLLELEQGQSRLAM